MKTALICSLLVVTLGIAPAATGAEPKVLRFGGQDWVVRSGNGGPGPNAWDPANAWLDPAGALHLRVARRDDRWSCAELTTRERLGFGRYEFRIDGRIDRFDDNVVLGLFNYPTGDVGGDGTHEIDVEFARWGNPKFPNGNFTVWPVERALKPTSKTFEFALPGNESFHRFEWDASKVLYKSFHGPGADEGKAFARWEFRPVDAEKRVARKPMPVHLNLWLFQGHPPKDGKEVEVVVRAFGFAPAPQK